MNWQARDWSVKRDKTVVTKWSGTEEFKDPGGFLTCLCFVTLQFSSRLGRRHKSFEDFVRRRKGMRFQVACGIDEAQMLRCKSSKKT
jgi:hypothetical protein